MKTAQISAPIWQWTNNFWEFQHNDLFTQSHEQLNGFVYSNVASTSQTLHVTQAAKAGNFNWGWNNPKLYHMTGTQPHSSLAISWPSLKKHFAKWSARGTGGWYRRNQQQQPLLCDDEFFINSLLLMLWRLTLTPRWCWLQLGHAGDIVRIVRFLFHLLLQEGAVLVKRYLTCQSNRTLTYGEIHLTGWFISVFILKGQEVNVFMSCT